MMEFTSGKWPLPLCVYSVWIADKATVWGRQRKPESICVAKQVHEEKTSTCHMYCVREKLQEFMLSPDLPSPFLLLTMFYRIAFMSSMWQCHAKCVSRSSRGHEIIKRSSDHQIIKRSLDHHQIIKRSSAGAYTTALLVMVDRVEALCTIPSTNNLIDFDNISKYCGSVVSAIFF